MVFIGLVMANLGLILSNRSWSRSVVATIGIANCALFAVVAGAALVLAAVLGIPTLRSLFHFAPLQLDDVFLGVGAGLVCLALAELAKLLHRRR